MPTHTMKLTKTNSKEVHALYSLLNELEWLHQAMHRSNFEDVEWDEFEILSKMGKRADDGERDPAAFIEDLAQHASGIHFQRILTNLETLLEHCADPGARTLEFHPDIAEGLAMLKKRRSSEPGQLLEAKPVELRHADLDAVGDSPHTTQCPKCEPGTLAMRRDEAGVLMCEDACLFCGQRVVYTDVKDGEFVEA